jgi:hypothetical protein
MIGNRNLVLRFGVFLAVLAVYCLGRFFHGSHGQSVMHVPAHQSTAMHMVAIFLPVVLLVVFALYRCLRGSMSIFRLITMLGALAVMFGVTYYRSTHSVHSAHSQQPAPAKTHLAS